MKVSKHQQQFLNLTKEYTAQINLLLDMAEKADRVRLARLQQITNKLKSSLQKLQKDNEKLKQYANNPAKYMVILQLYVKTLDEIKGEIQRETRHE